MDGGSMSHARVNGDYWSKPENWSGGSIPKSGNGLHVTSNATYDDLGEPGNPFVAHDVEQVLPSALLLVTGTTTVTHDLDGISTEVASGSSKVGHLEVGHDLNGRLLMLSNSYVRVGHDLGSHKFSDPYGSYVADPRISFIQYGTRGTHQNAMGSTLVLDKPPSHELAVPIVFPTGAPAPNVHDAVYPFDLKIELGKLKFDHADLIPNPPGMHPDEGDNSTLRLTQAGKTVYQLTNVLVPQDGYGGKLSVGTDSATGYNFVEYKNTV
jgi:hypothetical protein